MIFRLSVLEMGVLFTIGSGWALGADSSPILFNDENNQKAGSHTAFGAGFSEHTGEGIRFEGGSTFQKGFQFGGSFGNEWNSSLETSESVSDSLTTATLILPGENPDPNQLRQLHEDMVVFSEILQEGLRPLLIRPDEMVGGDLSGSFPESGQRNRSTYIEGYGAVFPLYVDFPLIGRGKSGASSKEDRKDLVWETAKDRIWNSRPSRKPAEVSYDAQRIERLKDTLAEGIRHGSNIRGLSEKEWIVVAVQCRPPRPKIGFEYFYGKALIDLSTPSAAAGRNNPSALILRVSKGAVDAAAEGRMTKEEYRKNIRVITY